MMDDEKGQIAVDFLLGISLVLIALSFTMQFIPGLFTTGATGESSLDYTAYRSAAILAEDTGWWENSTSNGTDWESHTSDTLRIGLAMDDEPGTRLTNEPNLLSQSKIERFMLIDENTLIEMLGLYSNVEDSIFAYGYNISIKQNGATLILDNTAITRGRIAPVGTEISKITRLVLVEKGSTAVFTGEELTGISSSKASINVTGPFKENITIQLRNLTISGPSPVLRNASLDGSVLSQPADYTVYKMEGWETTAISGSIDTDDVVCLCFNHNLFSTDTSYRLDLEFSNVTFTPAGTPYVNYNEMEMTRFEPARLVVEVW